jgi:PBP1b-binding outer membrane lipoprotein LpoB
MKKVNLYLLYTAAIMTISSCTKNSNESSPLPARELLTSKPWKLISYGFDSNKNGMIDSNEDAIKDCETDNTYVFNKGGSGVVNENSKICDGSEPSHSFIWALRNNDTVLDLYFGAAYIAKLSADSLYLTDSNSDAVKLLLIYSH